MAEGRISVLSGDEIELVHENTLRTLGSTGVLVRSGQVR